MTMLSRYRLAVLLPLFLGIALVGRPAPVEAQGPAADARLADYFGFQPLELYKLERRIGNLVVRDVDGDGIGDVIVGNNARSRIDLLLSTKRPEGEAEERPFRKEANELESDKRMRSANISVNKEIVSLAVGDFNGDGKPDLVYYGTPAEVEILFNQGLGKFGAPKHIRTGEAVEGSNTLAVGDLDQDGRDDIALIAEKELILIHQTAPGVLSEPERAPHTASNPRMLKIHDLNGDGAADLLILDGGADHPVHVRFATQDKKLGPEQPFAVESPRAIAYGQIDGKPGVELLTIENTSGRGKVYTLDESSSDDSNKWGRMIFFGLSQGSERGRALAVGDLDGDKKQDVIVTDPSNAQVWVYRQSGESGLNTGQSFPGLLGGKAVVLADLDMNGSEEAYILSEQEKQIGRSQFEDGRLSFPTPLPIKGEPVAMSLAVLEGSATPAVVYAARTKPGADSFELRAIRRGDSGEFAARSFGPQETVPITGLSGAPTAIRAFDVNSDGETDLIIFSAYGSPVLLLGQPKDHSLAPFGGSLGPLGGATPSSLSVMKLKQGPALIVAQNTFARRLVLGEKGQWEIKDQYNAGRASVQIQGAAALDVTGKGDSEVVLLDRVSKSLLFLTPKNGVYRQAGSLAIGSLNFDGMHVADFDGDGRDDLLIAGTDRFAVLQTGSKGQRLKEIASYEPKRKDARLADLIAGDLNADGVPDVVFTDVAEHALDIASYGGDEDLLHAITFKLFERKSYRGGGDMLEPRDMAIGDVDGDGRADLVLILHDRVVILRQDAGSDDEQVKATAAK